MLMRNFLISSSLLVTITEKRAMIFKGNFFYLEHAKLKRYWKMQCNSGPQNSRDLVKEYLLVELIFYAPHTQRNTFQGINRPAV